MVYCCVVACCVMVVVLMCSFEGVVCVCLFGGLGLLFVGFVVGLLVCVGVLRVVCVRVC